MNYKIYKESNYILLFIDGATVPVEDAAKDVVITRSHTSETAYDIYGPRLGTHRDIELANLLDITDTPYASALVFNSFYRQNTGFSSASGGSEVANLYTGWGNYVGTLYTAAVPLTLLSGVKVTMPNNKGSFLEIQKPADVTTFYSGITQRIISQEGDSILVVLEFKVKPLSGAADIRVLTSIDIGGGVGEIYENERSLNKGNGVEHSFLINIPAYTLNTWAANGGAVKIQAINSNVALYDVRYVIHRLHKAR